MTAKSQNNKRGEHTAFFAGSFDPFTVGHASVVGRALKMFDRVIIAIGINSGKSHTGDTAARIETIKKIYADDERVEVISYDGLTVDAATRSGACCLLRGVRSVKDFEYERDLADVNRQLSGLETVLIYSLPQHAALSSSIVRELQAYGKDVNAFLP